MKYEDLIDIKSKICSDYIKYYKNNGFEEFVAMPLYNKNDITLDFTTCTVCTAKENIKENKKGKDYVMIQPALRNTHIDVLRKADTDDYFFSFFSMMGGFKYYNNQIEYQKEFSELIKSEFDFLKKYNSYVLLTIPIQYNDNLKIDDKVTKYLKTNGCGIKYSDNDEKNLKWKYGINNVVGYGTRWEIANGGDLVNWGNTINVFVDGKPFGIDFGGGVESLMYSNLNLKNSIYANDAMIDNARLFCCDDSIKEKMLDCIISAMCIIANKPKIALRDKYILEIYMNLLSSYMTLSETNQSIISELVREINENNIPFLHRENMKIIFEQYLEKAIKNQRIILNSDNMDKILNLVSLCYNGDENWKNSKKIINSHFSKYFSNLSEVDLLALQKSKIKKKERKK